MTNEELAKATYDYCTMMGIDTEKDIAIELKDFVIGKDVIKHKDQFKIVKQFEVVKTRTILSHYFLTESINETLKLNYMTNTQLEIATYNYCTMMGIDWNETVFIEPNLNGKFYEKRFDVVKRIIKSHYTVMKSIEFTLNSSKENV